VGVVVNHIMTAGTAAQAIMVKMISHTAVVFSAIKYEFRSRYINFQIGFFA
jgi:hypothetical protein